ncbi:nuclear nucleic acid-binding protein C1D-like [Cylas formicarius]|uniref:nuclear nucleic acid-binding protein C1D-like n=1 Tax=Cylas formicarius TaxID=197179 RepID=UPI0029587B1B|nr:nuclear nucleic acid-binding protein C1D-like [Cylas formicarius]
MSNQPPQMDLPLNEKLKQLDHNIGKLNQVVDQALNMDREKLTLKEKIDLDLFVAYTLNAMFWTYIKTLGLDPTKNEVKNQLNRVKDYMEKAKQAHERQTIRPKLVQKVAARFIKHGINNKQ